MTKIQIMSDIHTEFGNTIPPVQDVDIAICAGDLGVYKPSLLKDLKETWSNAKHVVYVPGNHEYYHQVMDKTQEKMQEDCNEVGIHYLNPGHIDLDGVLVVGATLWTDFRLDGIINEYRAHQNCSRGINDFRGGLIKTT